MMKYMYVFVTLFLLTACSTLEQNASSFIVHAFKVGKADSFLVSSEGAHVLIDTGEDDDGEKIVQYLQQHNITKLDALIITHFDKDHVGGADHVLRAVEAEVIYVPDYKSDSKQTKQFLQVVKERGYQLTPLTTDTELNVQGATGMMYPPEKSYKGDNNHSLVIRFAYGETSFLFAGDIEAERTKDLLAQSVSTSTFLKLPHHGRFNEQTANLVDAVQPQIALITSSSKKPEAQETLHVLEEIGATVYTTREGDVTFTSDGSQISINK